MRTQRTTRHNGRAAKRLASLAVWGMLLTRSALGQTTALVSLDSSEGLGDAASYILSPQSVSNFGRYVVFVSGAGNLVPNDNNATWDIFVRDRQMGTTSRVSVSSAGVEADAQSGWLVGAPSVAGFAISADGRYVVFASEATNLVAGDTNAPYADIFIRDTQTNTTSRVSLDSSGNEANGSSLQPSVSLSGRYVAFTSAATNLVTSDNNGLTDVFVRDRQLGTTIRVSESTSGTEGNGVSGAPSISADGRFISFQSDATNLIAGDTNAKTDVYVHDRDVSGDGTYDQVGDVATFRVSVASDGSEGDNFSAFGASGIPNSMISQDGNHVAFASAASNLISGDNNGTWDIFVHEISSGTTSRVSVSSAGTEAVNFSFTPSISSDGRFVAFVSKDNLLDPPSNIPSINGEPFVHDRDTDGDGIYDEAGAISTERMNVTPTGGQAFSFNFPVAASVVSISPSGSDVVYPGFDVPTMNPADTNGSDDVFLRNTQADRDGDGLLDAWEVIGVDFNGDGTNDFTLPNANPLRKNLYVEVDAMTGRAPNLVGGSLPTGTSLDPVVAAFANAPLTNPDGSTGVDLEILISETNLPFAAWASGFWGAFDVLKDNPFGPGPGFLGTPAERGNFPTGNLNWPNIRGARMLTYRYCIFADQYCINLPNPNFPVGPMVIQMCSSSGRAEIKGNDCYVTLGGCDWSGCWSPAGGTNSDQAGAFMHEFGHTLNLLHGGGDNINFKPIYYSNMNYSHTMSFGAAGQQLLDYSGAVWPSLNESCLDETQGISGPINVNVAVGPPQAAIVGSQQSPYDFDRDGSATNTCTSADVNDIGGNASPGELLNGYDDWANIWWPLSGSSNFADGPAGQGNESGAEIARYELDAVAEAWDCNANGVVDSDDILLGDSFDCDGDGRPDECGKQERYDSYADASAMHGQGGWKGWDNDPAFSAPVTQVQSHSFPQSVDIAGAADLVHEYCGLDSDVWSFSVWQYIPTEFASGGAGELDGSYFNLLNTYTDGGPYHWSVQVQFDSNDGMLKAWHGDGDNTIQVPYETDRWVKIQTIIDLESDWTQIYYDDELVTEYTWTGGVLGGGGGVLDIAAVDLYANGSSSVYYDDLKIETGCGNSYFDDFDLDGLDTATELRLGTDSCTPDTDEDGHLDSTDNCATLYNPDQADTDTDLVGDICDRCEGFADELDCNNNALPDGCDILEGLSFDDNFNGIPDECELPACVTNLDCQDADPCIRAICDSGSGTCANHPRFYGDLNHDGLKNIIDLVCEARVAFQGLTVCSGFQIDEAEVDYGPNDAGCGDGLINIVDVIITARIAFQNLDDDCCGVSSALSCSEVTGGAPHCP